MANRVPSFITGAKALVKVYDQVLAFCSDVSYNVNVQHIPVESLGVFEIIANEPVSYTVDGTFSVVRYASNSGNLATYTTSSGEDLSGANSASQIKNSQDKSLADHINPAQILSSTTFDMEVIEKIGTAEEEGATRSAFFKIKDCRITRRGSTLNKRGLLVDNYAFVGVLAEDGGTETAPTPSGD